MSLNDMLLSVSPMTSVPYQTTDGAWVANGKIGILTSMGNNIGVTKAVITRETALFNGIYDTNTSEVFNVFGWKLGAGSAMLSTSNVGAGLNLYNGMSSNNYVVLDGSNNTLGSITTKLFALRHLPFTSLQTLEFTGGSNLPITDLYHCVVTPNNLANVEYNHTFVNVISGNTPPKTIFQLYGTGTEANNSRTVAFTTSYMVTGGSNVVFYGAQRDPKSVTNITYRIGGTGISRVDVLTTFMTSDDYDNPLAQTKIQSTTYAKWDIPYIIGKHTDAWGRLWNTHIRINSIDPSASKFNKLLNTALYNIYASIRENYIVGVSSILPVLDMEGRFLYDADIWLVPLLVILKPDLVKSILEYRYAMLDEARRLAASYGFKGAKYPSMNDVLGYKNSLWYSTVTYINYITTFMVGVNCWNYYRVTKDKTWLVERGAAILFEIAQLITTAVVYDENKFCYSIPSTAGLNGTVSASNNALTNNLARLVLQYAIQAMYETRQSVPDIWQDVYNGILLQTWPVTLQRYYVSKFDDDAVDTDTYNIMEPLMNFLPSLWEEVRKEIETPTTFFRSVISNIGYYDTRLIPSTKDDTTNIVLRGISYGLASGVDSTYATSSNLQAFIDNAVSGIWYSMKPVQVYFPDIDDAFTAQYINSRPLVNSLHTNAMFLSMITQGFSQLRVVGGVDANRLPYLDYKVVLNTTANLPSGWNTITFNNIAGGNLTFDTRPSGDGMGSNGSNLGGGGYGGIPVGGTFAIYTP